MTKLPLSYIIGLLQNIQDALDRGVTLEEAMKDPAYQIHDPYVGPDGIDWMERWAKAMHKDLPWDSWQDPPKQIIEEYNRADADQR